METSTSKAEIIKVLLFKAGIPLTLSLAAFAFARNLAARRVTKDSVSDAQLDSLETESHFDRDRQMKEEALISPINLVTEIVGLKTRIEELQKKEWDFETWLRRYDDLNKQESMLMKLSHALFLEIARAEFLGREIALIEDENRRVGDLVIRFFGALENIESWRAESGSVQRKAKKISRRVKVQSSLIRERDAKIRAREAEILRFGEMLKVGNNVLKKLEDEVGDLRLVLDRILDEKNALSMKLDFEQRSASSSSKKAHEEQSRAESELDQLKKDRESEINEIVNLRWNNACLKHELTKIKEHEEQQDQQRDNWKLDFQQHVELGNYDGKEKTGFETEISDRDCSKRKKLVKRFRKWVEGKRKRKRKRKSWLRE